ncbi:MAG: HAD family hydrolase [Actinomycetota bacterium]|nr:HAD family hydrolase [Actinomycetota bacterium]
MPLPTRVEAVFCDVGGPIYPDDSFTTAVLTALDEMRAGQGREPVDRDEFRRMHDDMRAAQSGGFRRTLARELLGDESLRGELHERTGRWWTHPAGTAYGDALAMFRALHGHVVTGVLANQEAATADALRRDGFADVVDVWGVSALVGHEKPSRELFDWALEQAGTTAAHAVHIGNRLDTDVRPARALGLATIWVTRGEAPEHPTPEQVAEADVTVADLTGVADLLLPLTGPRRG